MRGNQANIPHDLEGTGQACDEPFHKECTSKPTSAEPKLFEYDVQYREFLGSFSAEPMFLNAIFKPPPKHVTQMKLFVTFLLRMQSYCLYPLIDTCLRNVIYGEEQIS